jgi:hypothetical protein
MTFFQSNEYDPRGFYDEEEDSDEEGGGDDGGCAGDGRDDPSMEEEWHRKDGEPVNGHRQGQGNVGKRLDLSHEHRRDGHYHEIHSSSRLDNHLSNGIERGEDAAGVKYSSPPTTAGDYDPHATDELLALLGAEPPPPTRDECTAPRYPPRSSNDEPGNIIRQINDTAAVHDNGNPAGDSQFLAGIIKAEERIHNRAAAAAATANSKWSFGDDDSRSDGFGGWHGVDDGRFDGNDSENDDRNVNTNIINNALYSVNGQEVEETGPACRLSNFKLPSADESSSSEEEDDSGEEEEDDDE